MRNQLAVMAMWVCLAVLVGGQHGMQHDCKLQTEQNRSARCMGYTAQLLPGPRHPEHTHTVLGDTDKDITPALSQTPGELVHSCNRSALRRGNTRTRPPLELPL